jgi:hypothetical protein
MYTPSAASGAFGANPLHMQILATPLDVRDRQFQGTEPVASLSCHRESVGTMHHCQEFVHILRHQFLRHFGPLLLVINRHHAPNASLINYVIIYQVGKRL